jgi:hypothetical protein
MFTNVFEISADELHCDDATSQFDLISFSLGFVNKSVLTSLEDIESVISEDPMKHDLVQINSII